MTKNCMTMNSHSDTVTAFFSYPIKDKSVRSKDRPRLHGQSPISLRNPFLLPLPYGAQQEGGPVTWIDRSSCYFSPPLIMDLIVFLLVGLIAGWLAGELYKGSGFGLVGNIVVGILGALIGGYLFGTVFNVSTYGLLGSILTATVGAVILLFLINLVRRTN